MLTAIEVKLLKAKARRQYSSYLAAYRDLGCGNQLADHVTGGRRQRIADEFNATMDKLAQIDPEDTPSTRL